MNGNSDTGRGLRDRIAGHTEERIGRALSDLLENPLLSGAIGRAFDAREKAAQAQELAMGALNLPSAADIERLTRRLRSVSQRLEGIEDGVSRVERGTGARLAAIEQQLQALGAKLEALGERASAVESSQKQPEAARPAAKPAAGKRAPRAKPASSKPASSKPAPSKRTTRRSSAPSDGTGG